MRVLRLHAYTAIGTDILARHMRQRGEDVFFLTGTDEHGEPVAQAADREGVTPRELADRNAERFKALMPLLAHYDAQRDFVVPRSRYNEARAFIEAGLDDVSLSRASVQWGIPLPWDPEQTIYV